MVPLFLDCASGTICYVFNLGIVQPAKELGCELYSVRAREPHHAKRFSEEFNFLRYHSSYEELVSDSLVRIIYNPLPNGLHTPWNIKALENGKHVFTEKPFASNYKEAKILKHADDVSGKLLMEAFRYCFHPVTNCIYSLVESGILGKLKHIEITLVLPEAADHIPGGIMNWPAVLLWISGVMHYTHFYGSHLTLGKTIIVKSGSDYQAS